MNHPYQCLRSKRGSLSEQVAQQIIQLVSGKQLEAGERLPSLEELTQYLGVSRTAVREAIKLLDAWGVVTVRHGVGTFVADDPRHALTIPFKLSAERSTETLHSLLQFLQTIEPGIAALAAENAEPEHLLTMEEAIRKMDASTTPDEFNEADLAFHLSIANASGNPIFLIVIHPIIDLVRDMCEIPHRVAGAAERAQDSHLRIVESIRRGDAEGARAAMDAHMQQIWLEIQRQMAESAGALLQAG